MTTRVQDVEVRFTVSPGESWSVGVLAIQGHHLFFEYHPSWLQRGLELSSFILPAKAGLVEHQQRSFGPLFGLFDEVAAAVERWLEFARVAGVRGVVSARISRRLASIRFGHKG